MPFMEAANFGRNFLGMRLESKMARVKQVNLRVGVIARKRLLGRSAHAPDLPFVAKHLSGGNGGIRPGMLCEGTDGGVRTGICRAVETGEATGELPPDFPERVTAAIIVTYLQGFSAW